MRLLSTIPVFAALFAMACTADRIDAQPDAGGGESPIRCESGQACSVIPDAEGSCAGVCIDQPDVLRCGGRVVSGVCLMEPAPGHEGPGPVGGLSLVVASKPGRASPGDVVRFEIRLENEGSGALTRQVELGAGSGFELVSSTPATPGRFTIPAGGALAIAAELRAVRPTVLVPLEWGALWVHVANEGRALPLPVDFGASGELACGNATFPAQWCEGEGCSQTRRMYASARCCDGVFYPGATCCSSLDCSEGACIDGRCVRRAPALSWATTLLNSPQRVLLVLSDIEVPAGSTACTNLAPQLAGELRLGEVQAWFGEVLRTRAARDATPFEWTILGGLKAADFAGEAPYYSGAFTRAAEAWLKERGCVASFDDFDKVIVASPLLEPAGGATAEAFAPGRIASRAWTQPLLFAHELAHTFGASDLYLDAAGFLQHRLDLMGDNLGALGPPRDGVLWGEIGLGDLDRNGIIDLAEFAASPEALELREISAKLMAKGTLEVTADVGGREGGAIRRVNLTSVGVEVPADGARQELVASTVATFPPEQVDIERIRAAGAVTVRITTEYRYTATDFSPKRLTLDVTRTVPIAP